MSKKISGTYEWAKYNENCIVGCGHGCHYCYSQNRSVKVGEKTPNNWAEEVVSRKALQKVHVKKDGRIMFPTRHDITPKTLLPCSLYLERMLSVGNEVLIVSKPHIECIDFICNAFVQYKNQIMFRFTIGSRHNGILRLWEPNAPIFEERLESLKLAYNMGYETSISCEPMLDKEIHLVVDEVRDYVTDAIWLGKANNLVSRITNNGATSMLHIAETVIENQNDENIMELYHKYKDDPIIKWKESIKKVVGLELPQEKGLDK